MQYTGLVREGGNALAGADEALTNCFASTYSLLTTFDTAAFNIKTFNTIPGTIKIFDVLALDPITILADSAVNYE